MSYEARLDFTHDEEKTIRNINKRLKNAENELYALTHLKRATKKDGTPFQRLGDNYPGAKVTVARSYSGYVSNVEISGSIGKYQKLYSNYEYVKIALYVLNSDQQDVSFEDVEKMIARYIFALEDRVKSYKSQLKEVHKAYAKIKKEAERVLTTLNNTTGCFDETSHRTTLAYELIEYLKGVIY